MKRNLGAAAADNSEQELPANMTPEDKDYQNMAAEEFKLLEYAYLASEGDDMAYQTLDSQDTDQPANAIVQEMHTSNGGPHQSELAAQVD